jgi:hypothetical protein
LIEARPGWPRSALGWQFCKAGQKSRSGKRAVSKTAHLRNRMGVPKKENQRLEQVKTKSKHA